MNRDRRTRSTGIRAPRPQGGDPPASGRLGRARDAAARRARARRARGTRGAIAPGGAVLASRFPRLPAELPPPVRGDSAAGGPRTDRLGSLAPASGAECTLRRGLLFADHLPARA